MTIVALLTCAFLSYQFGFLGFAGGVVFILMAVIASGVE